MDIELPNGVVIQGVPEGTTKQQVMMKAISKGLATKADFGIESETVSNQAPPTLQLGAYDTGIEIPEQANEFLAGAGMRLSQIASLGTHKPDDAVEKSLNESPYGVAGQVTGDIAGIAAGGGALGALGKTVAGVAPKAGQVISKVGSALTSPKNLKQAAGAGAVYGTATSEDRLTGALSGGAGGGLGYAIPAATGAVVKPHLEKGAEMLYKRGIKLTPGEMLGGWVQRIEDGATSIPFVGDFIKSAKKQSLKSFNISVINDALKSVGSKLDDSIPAGREAIDQANEIISRRYTDILENMNVVADDQFRLEIANLYQMVKKLPPAQRRKFDQVVKDRLMLQIENPNERLLGETFKEVDSAIRKEYKRFHRSNDPMNQDLGDALREVHQAVIGLGKRQNPEAAKMLLDADKAYAMLSRVNDAASFVGAKDGIFTPSHLVNAVKKSATKRQFARGKAHGQELAEAAKDVLPSTVPDSGTPMRAMTGGLALGGAAYLDPAVVAAMAAGAGAYTRPSVNVLSTAIGSRPAMAAPVGNALRKIAPYTGAASVPLAINVNQQ